MLFTTVASDGIGDLTHLEDIVLALRGDPYFNTVELVLDVFDAGFSRERYNEIVACVERLNIKHYVRSALDMPPFRDSGMDEREAQDARESCQFIGISLDRGIGLRLQQQYAPTALLKRIGEHEDHKWPYIEEQTMVRSLGLSPDCMGIKISALPADRPMKEHINTIMQQDAVFYHALMQHTGGSDFEQFLQDAVLVPAYFNKPNDALDFLRVLGQYGETLAGHKEIVVYLSGTKELSSPGFARLIKHKLRETDFTHIELIDATTGHPVTIRLSDKTPEKTLTVFTGFFVTTDSFHAMHQLAPKLAGVSGDNTLERCISLNILPYYYSTNADRKIETLTALQRISQLAEIEMTPAARDSFRDFFNHDALISGSKLLIDFKAMIDAWPNMTTYLRAHHNFYDKLRDVMLEGLAPENRLDASHDEDITADVSSMRPR